MSFEKIQRINLTNQKLESLQNKSNDYEDFEVSQINTELPNNNGFRQRKNITYNRFYPKRSTAKSSRETAERHHRMPVPNVSFEDLRKEGQITTTPNKLKISTYILPGRGYSQEKITKMNLTNKNKEESLKLFKLI